MSLGQIRDVLASCVNFSLMWQVVRTFHFDKEERISILCPNELNEKSLTTIILGIFSWQAMVRKLLFLIVSYF